MSKIGFDVSDELALAWAAGLFDGEGSISTTNPKDRPNPRIELSLSMTCEKTVRLFCEIVGVGNVIELKHYELKGYKKQWRWQLQNHYDIAKVIRKLQPYLITKKDALNKALDFWHENFDVSKSRNWKNLLAKAKEEMPHAIN